MTPRHFALGGIFFASLDATMSCAYNVRMVNKGFSEQRARHRGALTGSEKKPVNLRVSEDLLKAAKAAGLNLSQTLEQALSESLRQIERDRWLSENREAIDYYNSYIEKHGVFSQGRRRF